MKAKKENIEIIDLITNYLAGEADKAQATRVEEWIRAKKENKSLFEDLKKTWINLEHHKKVQDIDVDAEWSRMKSRLQDSSKFASGGKIFNISPVFRVAAAAIILIAFTLGALYITKWSYSTYLTADASGDVWLPDSTHVILNVHSKIRYPKKFGKSNRVVRFDGEAFFEVTPDKYRPFKIRAGEVNVEVLGTSFDLKAYKDAPVVEVVVNTGKVSMSKGSDEANHVILEAGTKGSYASANETFSKSLNYDLNYLAWKTGKLVFVDEELEHVVEVINRVYHCHIVLQSAGIRKCRITSTFDQMSLDAVLNVLVSTLELEIRPKGDDILLSGKPC